jgi:hypothetical protein
MRKRPAFRSARDVQHFFDGGRAVGLAQARQEALFSQRRGNLPKRIAGIQRLRGGDSVGGDFAKILAAFADGAAVQRDVLAVAVSVDWWSLLRAPERAGAEEAQP